MTRQTLFVTCGATVPFPGLIDCVLSQAFIDSVVGESYSRVIVQIGKGYTDEFIRKSKHYSSVGEHISSLSAVDLGCKDISGSWTAREGKLEIIGIEYSTTIEEIISKYSDLVISHAGTGSILDSLRLNKPLIVVVNDKLMDNHQQQIANKFESLGYVLSCGPIEKDLAKCIKEIHSMKLEQFPQARNPYFENAVLNMAYSV